MKIYLDLLLILNFAFDFILLLSVSILLRRNIPIYKIMLGAFIGSLSILLLFFNINSFTLFILKLFISILMILITFSFKDIKYFFRNLFYLYMSSIILGGFLYFLNIEFSYQQKGLVFFHNGLSINFIFLIIFSPIIIYIYIRQGLRLKNTYNNYYQIQIFHKNKTFSINTYLDTGNTLVDPIKKRPVLLINEKVFKKIEIDNYFYIPFQTINGTDTLKCITIDQINIKGIGIRKKVVVGLIKEKINIDGISGIIPPKILEE